MKPEVCPTSGLPFWGEARGVPHPPPSSGYRTYYIDYAGRWWIRFIWPASNYDSCSHAKTSPGVLSLQMMLLTTAVQAAKQFAVLVVALLMAAVLMPAKQVRCCSRPFALRPLPFALNPLPSALRHPPALCPPPFALRPSPSALCPPPSALRASPSALCPPRLALRSPLALRLTPSLALHSALLPFLRLPPFALCPLPSALCPPLALCSPSALHDLLVLRPTPCTICIHHKGARFARGRTKLDHQDDM